MERDKPEVDNPGPQQAIAEPILDFERLDPGTLKERIAELLTMVGLHPDDMTKLPHQFRSGQLQRICIVRALALRPSLIVLDEAVSSLDMITQANGAGSHRPHGARAP